MGLTPAYRPFARFSDCKVIVTKLRFLGNIGDENMRWLLILLAVGACARREPPPKVVPIKPVSMTAERFSELDKRCFETATHLVLVREGRNYREVKQVKMTIYRNCLANYEIETKAVPRP